MIQDSARSDQDYRIILHTIHVIYRCNPWLLSGNGRASKGTFDRQVIHQIFSQDKLETSDKRFQSMVNL